MYPILFKIGNFNVYSYGVILALDLLVSLYLFIKFSRYFKIDSELAFTIFIINIIFLIIGGKMGYIISHFNDYYDNNFWHFLINLPIDFIYSGLAIQGAIIFSVISLFFISRYYKISFWNLLDNFSLISLFSIFIGRIGCLLAGCCYGKVCNCEYGIYLHGAVRYPTQLMESILSLIAFFVVYFYFDRLNKKGILGK
ncbi:MAG: prolipoprotein diacylglyceryl transferase, partial [bacterium]